MLLLAALKNSLLEEVLLMAYARIRLTPLGLGLWVTSGVLALVRGSYHLYQGWGPFVGNVAMGLIFAVTAVWFSRDRKSISLMPFIWAHFLLDAVAFVAPGILEAVDPGL